MQNGEDPLKFELENTVDLYLDFTGHYLDENKLEKVKKELKERVLEADEIVIICMESFEGILYQPKIVVTDRRIIYYKPKVLNRYELRHIKYEDIDTIMYNAGSTGGGISITNKDRKTLQADNFHKTWAEKIALYVGDKRDKYK